MVSSHTLSPKARKRLIEMHQRKLLLRLPNVVRAQIVERYKTFPLAIQLLEGYMRFRRQLLKVREICSSSDPNLIELIKREDGNVFRSADWHKRCKEVYQTSELDRTTEECIQLSLFRSAGAVRFKTNSSIK